MSRNAEVYDLGEVERALGRGRKRTTPAPVPTPTPTPAPTKRPILGAFLDGRRVAFFVSDFTQSLSVFIPGTTQMVRGQITLGLFFLSALVFLGALASAVLETIDRLVPTLELLGWSVALALWILGSAFVLAAAVHLTAVWSACEAVTGGDRPPRHPVVPAVASLIVPGWGQLLNGNRLRAMLFLGGCWLVAGTWVVCSPSTTELLSTYLPVVGPWEQLARAPLLTWSLKWTVPVVLWSLAVYDAATGAAVHRRPG